MLNNVFKMSCYNKPFEDGDNDYNNINAQVGQDMLFSGITLA